MYTLRKDIKEIEGITKGFKKKQKEKQDEIKQNKGACFLYVGFI